MKRESGSGGGGKDRTRPPLERMVRIHAAIQSGKYPNARRLAEDLEVNPKTIHRDLEFMRDRLNLPLEYDPIRFGYRYTQPVESFPSLQISEGELFSLMIAEKALQQYRGTPFERRLVGAFRKLTQALPDGVSFHLDEWERTISFHTTAEPVFDLETLDVLARAAATRKRLRIRYRKPGQGTAEWRTIDPYHLANVNGEWYLFSFDHLRKAMRTFAPARILSVEETGETFERPTGFSVEGRVRDSFGIHSREGDFEVVVRFEPEVADYVREKRWHASQELQELEGGGVEVRMRLGSLVEVERWVLSWGGRAVAVAPDSLVKSVLKAGRQLTSVHGANAGK